MSIIKWFLSSPVNFLMCPLWNYAGCSIFLQPGALFSCLMLYVRVTSILLVFYFYLAHSDTIAVTQHLSNVLCYSSSHLKEKILRNWNEIKKTKQENSFSVKFLSELHRSKCLGSYGSPYASPWDLLHINFNCCSNRNVSKPPDARILSWDAWAWKQINDSTAIYPWWGHFYLSVKSLERRPGLEVGLFCHIFTNCQIFYTGDQHCMTVKINFKKF